MDASDRSALRCCEALRPVRFSRAQLATKLSAFALQEIISAAQAGFIFIIQYNSKFDIILLRVKPQHGPNDDLTYYF